VAKAVGLLSGGLDSMLAVRLVQDQGVEVHAIHFVSVFNCGARAGKRLAARLAAEALECPLKIVDFTGEQLEIIRNPSHGYGHAANPCIDCHMAMIRRAADYVREIGADFIVTGEVVGQRPMSQRNFVLKMIDNESGLEGLVLRPLSARQLPETRAEKEGLVDRDKLEGIMGRTRSRQMELAGRFGLSGYPTPAGGCLLTDRGFGVRVIDLVRHGQLTVNDAHLTKVGRHYRFDDTTKVIVGRNQRENGVIETFAREGDVLLVPADIPGPTALLRGDTSAANTERAASLCARSSKEKNSARACVLVRLARTLDKGRIIEVAPSDDDNAASLAVADRKEAT